MTILDQIIKTKEIEINGTKISPLDFTRGYQFLNALQFLYLIV